ncbi:hypothetical protein FNF29_04919 [Cafeteria roenbergensis]|uniref:Uncharacterized protein n=1 Tax=Cafeteria roenbergensis TaxID=33653 RepID=A0A5A8CFY0_CAFRO|nr:hypothetical protein FNF29_04919 [Cafeteria roenbergensis]|eukprot:KAA0151030.1 hypothetical protein FNF29_04919 [Cafeteria roenbergensis]
MAAGASSDEAAAVRQGLAALLALGDDRILGGLALPGTDPAAFAAAMLRDDGETANSMASPTKLRFRSDDAGSSRDRLSDAALMDAAEEASLGVSLDQLLAQATAADGDDGDDDYGDGDGDGTGGETAQTHADGSATSTPGKVLRFHDSPAREAPLTPAHRTQPPLVKSRRSGWRFRH